MPAPMDVHGLSSAVWAGGQATRDQIKALLVTSIASGEDALVTAKKLEQYLDPSLAPVRNVNGRLVRNQAKGIVTATPGRGGMGSFSARRLTRTEFSAAHGDATKEKAATLPYVNGIKWNVSASHPVTDECDDRAEGGPKGDGVYPNDNIPNYPAHPQCLCYLTMDLADKAGLQAYLDTFIPPDESAIEEPPLDPTNPDHVEAWIKQLAKDGKLTPGQAAGRIYRMKNGKNTAQETFDLVTATVAAGPPPVKPPKAVVGPETLGPGYSPFKATNPDGSTRLDPNAPIGKTLGPNLPGFAQTNPTLRFTPEAPGAVVGPELTAANIQAQLHTELLNAITANKTKLANELSDQGEALFQGQITPQEALLKFQTTIANPPKEGPAPTVLTSVKVQAYLNGHYGLINDPALFAQLQAQLGSGKPLVDVVNAINAAVGKPPFVKGVDVLVTPKGGPKPPKIQATILASPPPSVIGAATGQGVVLPFAFDEQNVSSYLDAKFSDQFTKKLPNGSYDIDTAQKLNNIKLAMTNGILTPEQAMKDTHTVLGLGEPISAFPPPSAAAPLSTKAAEDKLKNDIIKAIVDKQTAGEDAAELQALYNDVQHGLTSVSGGNAKLQSLTVPSAPKPSATPAPTKAALQKQIGDAYDLALKANGNTAGLAKLYNDVTHDTITPAEGLAKLQSLTAPVAPPLSPKDIKNSALQALQDAHDAAAAVGDAQQIKDIEAIAQDFFANNLTPAGVHSAVKALGSPVAQPKIAPTGFGSVNEAKKAITFATTDALAAGDTALADKLDVLFANVHSGAVGLPDAADQLHILTHPGGVPNTTPTVQGMKTAVFNASNDALAAGDKVLEAKLNSLYADLHNGAISPADAADELKILTTVGKAPSIPVSKAAPPAAPIPTAPNNVSTADAQAKLASLIQTTTGTYSEIGKGFNKALTDLDAALAAGKIDANAVAAALDKYGYTLPGFHPPIASNVIPPPLRAFLPPAPVNFTIDQSGVSTFLDGEYKKAVQAGDAATQAELIKLKNSMFSGAKPEDALKNAHALLGLPPVYIPPPPTPPGARAILPTTLPVQASTPFKAQNATWDRNSIRQANVDNAAVTTRERSALQSYKGSDYRQMNDYMRNGAALSHQGIGWINESTAAIDRAVIPVDLNTRRGVNLEFNPDPNVQRQMHDMFNEWSQAKPGTVIQDMAFMSVSTNDHTPEGFAGQGQYSVIFEIQTPAGTKGLSLDPRGGGEDEIMLQRGDGVVVSSVSRDKRGRLLIRGRLVEP